MNDEQDKGSSKESARKVDARDSNLPSGKPAPEKKQQPNQNKGADPAPRQGGGSDVPDHKVKEGLHQSVRKD